MLNCALQALSIIIIITIIIIIIIVTSDGDVIEKWWVSNNRIRHAPNWEQ